MVIKSVLFLHMPQNPKSESSFIQVAPLGLVGMAHYIKDQLDIDVTIMNAGSFEDSLSDIAFNDYVLKRNFDLIMLDLHWHQQLFDVLQIINELKTEKNYIGVGGITASVFGRQLLEKNPNIDFLIKGEGEIPTVKLIQAINGKLNFDCVPNLVWRREDNHIQENEITFHADAAFLNSLNDWDLTIYDNSAFYNGKIKRNQKALDFYYVPIGRGCMEECSYCGGSNSSFKKCFNRKDVVFRSPEVVAKTIINVHQYHHFNSFYICYDIKEISEEWWISLFRLINKAKIEIGLYFEAYRIPSHRFTKAFIETFQNNKSQIILSPGCFSDIARYRFTSVRYTLKDLEDYLTMVSNQIPIYIYFSLMPDPEEVTVENVVKNIEWCQRILDRFWNLAIYVSPIVMEPNAPWETDPAKYEIEKEIGCLDDFIDNSNLYDKSSMFLGYKFDSCKLITAIYHGITNKMSLTDFSIGKVIIINSISDITYLNQITSDKTIIINTDNYGDFIKELFRNKITFCSSDKLLFREIMDVKDISKNINSIQLENMEFFSIPLYYAVKLRNCIAFKKEIASIRIYKNLYYYKLFFDFLKYYVSMFDIYENSVICIPNAIPRKIFPFFIKTEDQIKYYVASNNGNLFKEISIVTFKLLLSQVETEVLE